MRSGWEKNYSQLSFTRRGRVLTISLDDPDRLNAINNDMHHELSHVFTDAATDAGSDVVVLTGKGRAFSAGGDISRMETIAADPSVFYMEDRPTAKRIVYSLLDLEKPLIARINGHAMGLGATLALLCDVGFMVEGAKIGDPHVSIGLVAGDGGCLIWPQLIGFAKAKEFLMTGEFLTAERAASIGLVNHCVPAAELDTRVDAFCDKLCGGALRAIQWTKVTINVELKRIAHSLMDVGMAYESLTTYTPEHGAAARAFLETRRSGAKSRT